MTQRSNSTEHLAFDSKHTKGCFSMETMMWKAIALLSLVVSFIALIIGIVATDKAALIMSNSGSTGLQTSPNKNTSYPISCAGITGKSGLYTIQPISYAPPFQVYCDMDTAGGKWTLVATIHENNIDGKCTPGDKWSSEQGRSPVTGVGNWENRNTFGSIESVTDQDYKNPAYYTVNASNVMLWHVPNQKKIYEISDAAKLKYYTTNGFLNKSTVQNLFAKTFPLKQATGGLEPLFKMLKANSAAITGTIPTWYNYVYDSSSTQPYSIRDGGGDMYDGGNTVYFGTDRENMTRMIYNTPYFLYGSGVEVKTSTSYPFYAFAWIGGGLGSTQSSVQYFDYKVTSNYGADGRGIYAVARGTINVGRMTSEYTYFQVSNASNDPSICEVFFYISSTVWNSRRPTSLTRIGWRNSTSDAQNTVRFDGNPSNVLIGYTLLSKIRGRTILKTEVEAALRQIMNSASNFTFAVEVPHQIVPVTYAKGNDSVVLGGIPLQHISKVVPGRIQFRAFNSVGLPNALCPGVAVNSDNPEQMCVGGMSTSQRDISICGDFAGWKGIPGDQGMQTKPSYTGKSLDDINTSILMFVR